MALDSLKGAAAAVNQISKPAGTEGTVTPRPVHKTQVVAMPGITNSQISNINLENQAAENGNPEDEQEAEARIKSAVANANNKVKHTGRTNLEFSYNEEVKRIAIKVFDSETKEVIREIPAEETLEMLEKMYDLAGILVDERR